MLEGWNLLTVQNSFSYAWIVEAFLLVSPCFGCEAHKIFHSILLEGFKKQFAYGGVIWQQLCILLLVIIMLWS